MLSKNDKQKIIDLYISGLGSDTIAKQFNIHPNSVLKILKKNKIERRGPQRKIQIEDEQKIIDLYKSGESSPIISEKFNVSHGLILRYLKKHNIERRSADECHRIFPIIEDFFDNIDSEEKAYFLGFLYADGFNSIESNSVKIDLASKDRDILEKLSKLIYIEDPESHIKDYKRTRIYNGKERILSGNYININSKHICQQLNNLGCSARKSLTLKFPEWLIDPVLQKHFIRGYYDGDGGVHLSNKKCGGAGSKIISTLEFCTTMCDIIKQQTDITFGKPKNAVKNKNVYTVNISGNRQIAKFLNWLYQDSSIYLDRKYLLYLELLEKNKKTDELILAGTRGYSKRYYNK